MARSQRRVARLRVDRLASAIVRWIRAETRDVVQIVPCQPGGADALERPGSLMTGVVWWGHLVQRRRRVVVLRRQLSVALGAGVIVGFVALASGSGVRTGSVWWFTGIAVLLAGLAGAMRGRVDACEVARLLDRDLALDERIGTALELERTVAPPAGLAAVVVSEASAALAASVQTARAVCRSAPREWGTLATLATVLLLLLVLPVSSVEAGHRTGVSGAAAGGHAGKAAQTSARRTAASHVRGAHGTAAVTPARRSSPLRTAGVRAGRAATGEAARGSSNQSLGRRLSRVSGRGGERQTDARVRGIPSPAGTGTAAGAAAAALGQRRGPGRSGRAIGRSQASSSIGRTAATESGAPRAGGTPLRGRPARAGVAQSSAAARGVTSARHAQSGGESAGRAQGASRLVRRLPPRLATAAGGLPIQSGYAPSGRQTASPKAGSGSAGTGGSGAPRTATFDEGGNTGVGAFPYIPSSPGAVFNLDESLLLNYFSASWWFSAASW